MVPKSGWNALSEKLLGAFLGQPPPDRARAWRLIVLLVGAIGLADYVAGTNLSLALFYLVPISFATGWLGASAGVLLSVVCTVVRVAGDYLIVYPHEFPAETWWNGPASLAIFLFVVWLLHALLNLRRQLEHKVSERTSALAASVADRQRLQQDLLEVGARERSALGRELHDELGQHFVATAIAAQVLARKLDAKSAADANAIVRWIEEGIAKSRKLARGLMRSSIAPERLGQELEELAAASSRGQAQCHFWGKGPAIRASAEECAQLFRIAQEAVANALRHAGAWTITISLIGEDDGLCLIIEDDGCGLPATAGRETAGMGLRIMQHRAVLIGASFSLLSNPGEGTKVVCRLPHRAANNP
jgi:signal transduction histidine kinase